MFVSLSQIHGLYFLGTGKGFLFILIHTLQDFLTSEIPTTPTTKITFIKQNGKKLKLRLGTLTQIPHPSPTTNVLSIKTIMCKIIIEGIYLKKEKSFYIFLNIQTV